MDFVTYGPLSAVKQTYATVRDFGTLHCGPMDFRNLYDDMLHLPTYVRNMLRVLDRPVIYICPGTTLSQAPTPPSSDLAATSTNTLLYAAPGCEATLDAWKERCARRERLCDVWSLIPEINSWNVAHTPKQRYDFEVLYGAFEKFPATYGRDVTNAIADIVQYALPVKELVTRYADCYTQPWTHYVHRPSMRQQGQHIETLSLGLGDRVAYLPRSLS